MEFHRSRNTIVHMSMKKKKKRVESIPTLILQSTQPSHNAPSTSTSHQLNNEANIKVKLNIFKYSKQILFNIFDNSEKFNNEEFKKFITLVGILATKQTISSRTTQFGDLNSQSQSNVCVAEAYKQKIGAVDFQSLLDNDWLSDTIIDFVGKVLQNKCPSIHVYTTHFMATLLQDDTFSRVSRWHQNIHANVELLYIPTHVNQNHWMLCRLDFSKKEILLWNSSSMTSDNIKYLHALKKYIHQVIISLTALPNDIKGNKHKINKWKGEWSTNDRFVFSPQQGNFDDCGIFTILNMILLSSRVALTEYSYSQFEINHRKTRERIAQIIFQHIHWKGFVTNDIEDKQWLMFINRMNGQNSWNWVNHTRAL